MKKFQLLILLLGLAGSICSFAYIQESDNFQAEELTEKSTFQAGENIQLSFKITGVEQPKLYLHHSYGSTLLNESKKENDRFIFQLPEIFSKKTGELTWLLLGEEEHLLSGTIKIIPATTTKTQLETYLGPRSIVAGYEDFSMLVVSPTDSYDNPLPDSTEVFIFKQYKNRISEFKVAMNNMMAWRNMMSEPKAGIMQISSQVNGTSSKEFTSNIYPSNATNFLISWDRNHEYADGNQLTEFSTSVIKDEFENIIADGTMVEFLIHTEENHLLKTYASTINGIAKAKMLHPDSPQTWKVKAYIPGVAESNTIELTYQAILEDFPVKFSAGNRKITVGPLVSFMEQLIPDGAQVKLLIYNEGELIETKQKTSSNGKVAFLLGKEFYPEKRYSFQVKALGVTKEFRERKYE